MDSSLGDEPSNSSGMNMTISWRTVAVTSILVALASLTVMAVVAAVQDADTLSVVALALAVLAFVVQLIVFIVQAASASRQEVQMTEVYGRTLKALSMIEEKSEGTRRTVSTMNDRLLDVAIGKALPEAQAADSGSSPETLARDVSVRVSELLRAASGDQSSADSLRGEARRRESAGRRVTRMASWRDRSMESLPQAREWKLAAAALQNLDPTALSAIATLARDQRNNGRAPSDSGLGPGLRTINPYTAPRLVELGLVERRQVDWSPDPVFQLTNLGKNAGRLLMASSDQIEAADIPEGLKTLTVQLRRKLHDYEIERKTRARPEVMYQDIPIIGSEPTD